MHNSWLAVDRPLQARPLIQQASVKLVRLFQVVLNNKAICLMAKRQPFVCETKKFRLLSLGCVARNPDAFLGAVDEIADGLAHVTQCPRASASGRAELDPLILLGTSFGPAPSTITSTHSP